MIKVVFLDRDGTIIEDSHYPNDPKKVKLYSGAGQALRKLKEAGFELFVVSNQSGVARGLITLEQMQKVHHQFATLLEQNQVTLSGFQYCIHHPDENCLCRKPKIGMIPKTINQKPIDFSKSYVVGDRASDIFLGKNLKANPILVLTGYGKKTLLELNEFRDRFTISKDLIEATDWILKMDSHH